MKGFSFLEDDIHSSSVPHAWLNRIQIWPCCWRQASAHAQCVCPSHHHTQSNRSVHAAAYRNSSSRSPPWLLHTHLLSLLTPGICVCLLSLWGGFDARRIQRWKRRGGTSCVGQEMDFSKGTVWSIMDFNASSVFEQNKGKALRTMSLLRRG